jgi:hypothetical protein
VLQLVFGEGRIGLVGVVGDVCVVSVVGVGGVCCCLTAKKFSSVPRLVSGTGNSHALFYRVLFSAFIQTIVLRPTTTLLLLQHNIILANIGLFCTILHLIVAFEFAL